jgi:cyclic pyranopterin phosphate synthase
MSEERLTHIGEDGKARMVDVGAKQTSERMARARGRLRVSPATAKAIEEGSGPKGEVAQVARIAGIQAAKRTSELIPMAHPLALTFVDVGISTDARGGVVEIVSEARTRDRTGVEMEALTACSVAALTVYDMVKAIERGVVIEEIVLIEKLGGKSGHWLRDETGGDHSRESGTGPDE